MRLRRLESRIVVLFLALIVVVQMGSYFAIRNSINKNARGAIADQLNIGERVFERLLDQNAQKLTQSARLLAADYGFRAAIASEDQETIGSALANHGDRLGAAVAILVDTERRLRAAAPAEAAASLQHKIIQLVEAAELEGSASGTVMVKRRPYQVVVVPVKAPLIIGWVVMAFAIDQGLADDMRALTSLQVTMLYQDEDAKWQHGVSTLSDDDAALLTQTLDPGAASLPRNISIGDEEYGLRVLKLAQENGRSAVVVLQRSVGETVAPYRRLQITMLVLTVLGIVLALVGSIVTAKRITGPLRELGETAKRLGQGDYQNTIAVHGDEEVRALSQAFESMRKGIARREHEIRRLAFWDTLTGLPNRTQFTDVLEQAIAERAKAGVGGGFVLMMDLDRFKHVNDVLGHRFGDQLLRQIATRLLLQIHSETHVVARLGGDEFAVLLHGDDIDDALAAATRVLAAFEQPVALEEQVVDIGAGIGIAGFPLHGSDAETVLSRAEAAMYAAKERSAGVVVYDPAIDQRSQTSLSLLSELRQAIDRSELQLYVQPKTILDSGAVVGVEALVRWQHPERGQVFPDAFIPFAEKTGFIRVLTRWVLEQSAALCQSLEAQNVRLKFSVNLSTRDLLDQELPEKLLEILARYQVAPSSFCLEITESAIMEDPVRAQQTLERLHAMGVDLSIDDFGTGYSSLAYLKRLPVDELKIDKSFVLNMAHDANDIKIVRSTIDLGHNMGLRVVAEGIENLEAWSLLEKMGCDQGQGFFVSRPMPAAQLGGWLKTWKSPVLANEVAEGILV